MATCLILQYAGKALHAHARVDVLGRQRLQAAIHLPIELRTHDRYHFVARNIFRLCLEPAFRLASPMR